jgi:hypothetical protein
MADICEANVWIDGDEENYGYGLDEFMCGAIESAAAEWQQKHPEATGVVKLWVRVTSCDERKDEGSQLAWDTALPRTQEFVWQRDAGGAYIQPPAFKASWEAEPAERSDASTEDLYF